MLPSKRRPLAERQARAGQPSTSTKPRDLSDEVMSPRMPHHESLEAEGKMFASARETPPPQVIENKRLSAIADEAAMASKRASQASTTSNASTATKDRRKTHIGPWQLGKTLGKGATGRVRLARHTGTGKMAAVKIISKKCDTLAKSQSVAQMKQTEAPQEVVGQRPIPFSIEREIVVLKLIEHENIVNLYDIWENRGEIYLIMEYVEGGELFQYVSKYGRLPEQEAVRLFRQIIASLSYCHRFNVCHRDLKPENLLLDKDRNIKLADFGMAALQPEGRWLSTSCGSPHYAAPEIIHGQPYRGTQVDIWSCGIILYAMISGTLPFDGGDLGRTLRAIKKGTYRLPRSISPEAAQMIDRILQQDPEQRITLQEIWEHPLLKKWEIYHKNILPEGKQLVGPPPPLHEDDCGEHITSREGIDNEILRNLQTLWHGYNKADLIERLMSEEPNHERLFYRELMRFREEQREDYREDYQGNTLQHSKSDYHHPIKPKKAARRAARGNAGNHYRRGSQYSIVSDDGPGKRGSYYKKPATAGTNGSYDPYRASRTPVVDETGHSPTIIVRRSPSTTSLRHAAITRLQNEVPDLPSFTSEELHMTAQQKKSCASAATSRSSITSTKRDREVPATLARKRSVIFQHNRQKSSGNATSGSNVTEPSHHASSNADSHWRPNSKDTNHGISEMQATPPMPRKLQGKRPRTPASELEFKKTRTTSGIWREDARKVSTELSKICEEAFNRSSVTSSDVSRSRLTTSRGTDSPATAASVHQYAADAGGAINRSLPETPEQLNTGTALKELAGTRRRIIDNWGDSDPEALAQILAKLDERIGLERMKMKQADQRAASDPTHAATTPHPTSVRGQKLPSTTKMMDDLMDSRQDRAASDPGERKQGVNDGTVRLVSPNPMSPGVPLEPIQIRKKNKILMPLNSLRGGSSESKQTTERGGYDPRIHTKRELDTIEEDPKSPKKKSNFGSTSAGRKWSWRGKRGFEQEDIAPTPLEKKLSQPFNNPEQAVGKNCSDTTSNASGSKDGVVTSDEVQGLLESKKWFPKIFSRKEKVGIPLLATDHAIAQDEDNETESNESSEQQGKGKNVVRKSYPPATSVDAAAAASAVQPIQINQNWFAKFFHFKPASRVLMLQISKAKARKEIVKKLKEWRKYGIRDVVVEKRAGGDVIRARVDAQNCELLSIFRFFDQY